MDTNQRRNNVLEKISKTKTPITATYLAKELNVSRQVIVGDVAILRATGNNILATARGYVLENLQTNHNYSQKIACFHKPSGTKQELYTIVDLGATVVDIVIEHEIYGDITGSLDLSSRKDVDDFLEKVKTSKAKLLSELTSGVHLHTIACKDKGQFDQVYNALDSKGFIFKE